MKILLAYGGLLVSIVCAVIAIMMIIPNEISRKVKASMPEKEIKTALNGCILFGVIGFFIFIGNKPVKYVEQSNPSEELYAIYNQILETDHKLTAQRDQKANELISEGKKEEGITEMRRRIPFKLVIEQVATERGIPKEKVQEAYDKITSSDNSKPPAY